MLAATARAMLRYLLRVAIWCALAILAIVLLLRFVLPSLLPELLDEVSRHLYVNYGLQVEINEPTLIWEGAAPRITAKSLDFAGLQNAAFNATDVDISFSSVLAFLSGSAGRVDIEATTIIIRPEVSSKEAATTMSVPIKRNPYTQLSGLKPFIKRLNMRADLISYEGEASQLMAPTIRLDFDEEITFQFLADPTNTIIEGFNLTGKLLPEQQVVSVDVTPSELATDLLATLGLEPLTPFHMRLEISNFYNGARPVVHGKVFQGGHKFAELYLNDTQWVIDHIDYGKMAEGNFLLGAGFGWELYGQLLLEKWLIYAQSLPHFTNHLAQYTASGSLDFSLTGTSPLIPSQDFSLLANDVSIDTDNWGVTSVYGAVDVADGMRQQWYDVEIERLWWYLPEFHSSGHFFDVFASGELRMLDELFIVDHLSAKPLLRDAPIAIAGLVDQRRDQLKITVESPLLNYASVAMMVPLRKDEQFGLWITQALPMARFHDLRISYEGSIRPAELGGGNQLHGEAKFVADEFAYNDQWPSLFSASATIVIDNDDIRIADVQGRYQDVDFNSDSMTLTHIYNTPVLTMVAQTEGEAQTHLQYIAQSPIANTVAKPIQAFSPTGEMSLTAKLAIPMLKRLEMKTEVVIDAQLKGVDVTLPPDRQISNANGQIRYDRADGVVIGEDLNFTFLDGQASGAFQANVVEDQTMTVTADIAGRFDSQKLFAGTAFTDYASGVDEWKIHYQRFSPERDTITLRSQLANTQLNLPNGLRKNPDAELSLAIEKVSAATAILEAYYPGVIGAAMELQRDMAGKLVLKRGNLVLRADATPTLTSPAGIAVSGKLASLDLTDLSNTTGDFELNSGDFIVQTLRWGRYVVDGPMRLIMDRDQFGDTEITIDGAHLVGVVSIINGVFWADLATLSFRELPARQSASKPLRLPIPEAIPAAHITIYELIRNGRRLGSLKFAGQKQGIEYVIDNIALNTGEGWVQGSGRLQNLKPFTRLVFDLQSGQFGHVAGVFTGFKHFTMQLLLVSGSALLNQSGSGPLLASGDATVYAQNGRFYALNPAALDVLRVINPIWMVNALNDPEAGQSLRYNQIHAKLRLQPDHIAVDEASLYSDLANFHLHGWIGRETQSLNIGVAIAPRLSGVGALAGTILGGPLGAAIGIALGELPMIPGNIPPDVLSITGTIQKPIRRLLF